MSKKTKKPQFIEGGGAIVTGAEVFLTCLKKVGMKYIFGLPGSTEAAVLDVFVD